MESLSKQTINLNFKDGGEIKIPLENYLDIGNKSNSYLNFKDLPLSEKTLRGLNDANYIQLTEIQRESIPSALQGKDIFASAITGSGKTLAFLIPVIEHLYVTKWSNLDGVGAIIVSPIRELAYQIFETLKNIGKYHDFSAGLIIGGKNLKFEKKRMDKCNILICTPGRLLQHMDENPVFNASSAQILVLDEADRCLDMGFEKTMNAVLENLQPDRQTLLFSATQNKSLEVLGRLSLRNPVYIGPKENKSIVPELLQQNYVVVSLEDKLTMLWSFIKNHIKQKCIIFLASCKQVKYVYEIFCKLRPGTSLLALYGTLHQDRRISIYNEFVCKSKVVLFATDIASRGLHFPSVNWVVQLDCPEDITQYIHRAGRSARNNERGECLLVLTPSEELAMIDEFNKKNISIKKIHIDPKKMFSPRAKVDGFLAQNPELKASAKRAFISYIKSIFNMKNKTIFNIQKLNLEEFARSLGLVVTPRIRFMDRISNKSSSTVVKHNALNNVLTEFPANSDTDSDDLFTVKKKNEENDNLEPIENILKKYKQEKMLTKAAQVKKVLKKKISLNSKRKFDDQGADIKDLRININSDLSKKYYDADYLSGGINIELSKKLISKEDKFDKERFRKIIKIKHKTKNRKTVKSEDKFSEIESDDSINLSREPNAELVYNKSKSLEQDDYLNELDTKKQKTSPQLSLHDVETIASQILFNI